MCQLSGVSRSAFYRHWERSAPCGADTALRDEIQKAAMANRFYGYRRITKHLRHAGWAVNAKRVQRLMREDNLLCLRRRRFVAPTTDGRHTWRLWPNLTRGMETTALDQLWVADITYVRLGEEFVYAAVVLDAHSRRVIGWAVEWHLGTSLALRALQMALDERKPQEAMIHH
jgi:transposase InsO family protein